MFLFFVVACALVYVLGVGGCFFCPPRGKICVMIGAVGRGPKHTKNYKKNKTKHKTIVCQHKYKALEKKIKKDIIVV